MSRESYELSEQPFNDTMFGRGPGDPDPQGGGPAQLAAEANEVHVHEPKINDKPF